MGDAMTTQAPLVHHCSISSFLGRMFARCRRQWQLLNRVWHARSTGCWSSTSCAPAMNASLHGYNTSDWISIRNWHVLRPWNCTVWSSAGCAGFATRSCTASEHWWWEEPGIVETSDFEQLVLWSDQISAVSRALVSFCPLAVHQVAMSRAAAWLSTAGAADNELGTRDQDFAKEICCSAGPAGLHSKSDSIYVFMLIHMNSFSEWNSRILNCRPKARHPRRCQCCAQRPYLELSTWSI